MWLRCAGRSARLQDLGVRLLRNTHARILYSKDPRSRTYSALTFIRRPSPYLSVFDIKLSTICSTRNRSHAAKMVDARTVILDPTASAAALKAAARSRRTAPTSTVSMSSSSRPSLKREISSSRSTSVATRSTWMSSLSSAPLGTSPRLRLTASARRSAFTGVLTSCDAIDRNSSEPAVGHDVASYAVHRTNDQCSHRGLMVANTATHPDDIINRDVDQWPLAFRGEAHCHERWRVRLGGCTGAH